MFCQVYQLNRINFRQDEQEFNLVRENFWPKFQPGFWSPTCSTCAPGWFAPDIVLGKVLGGEIGLVGSVFAFDRKGQHGFSTMLALPCCNQMLVYQYKAICFFGLFRAPKPDH